MSFGAFHGYKLVSFTLNAKEQFYGKLTAYDTATGTIEAYRGQGLAARIFNTSLPVLKEAGVEQYLLEVLQHNTKAVSVYEKVGFTTHREFNYFLANRDEIKLKRNAVPDFQIKEITLDDKSSMMAMWDFEPSWQNSFQSLARCQEDLIAFGAFIDSDFVGYGVVEPAAGDIPQIAVRKHWRRKGIGSAILNQLAKNIPHENIKILNSDKADTGFTSFAIANGIPHLGSQYEMILDVTKK